MNNNRNSFWDFFKFISAVGVILVHAPFSGNLGKIMSSVGVLGVSFFYLISGYACFGDRETMCPKIRKRLIRNGLITAFAIALCMAFSYCAMKMEHTEFLWKAALKKPVTYVKIFFIGDLEFFYGSHLWFMIALLWCYVIFYIIVRFRLKIAVYVMLPVFLIARVVVETYVNSFNADWHWSGNALIGALPMMLLGYVIADKKEKLIKIPILGIKKPDWSVIRPIAYLGRKDSLYIYIFHFYVVILLAEYMYGHGLSQKVIDRQLPIASVICSVILARVLCLIADLIRLPFKSRKKAA